MGHTIWPMDGMGLGRPKTSRNWHLYHIKMMKDPSPGTQNSALLSPQIHISGPFHPRTLSPPEPWLVKKLTIYLFCLDCLYVWRHVFIPEGIKDRLFILLWREQSVNSSDRESQLYFPFHHGTTIESQGCR